MNPTTRTWPHATANMSAALTQPRIVQLSDNLFAAALEVMKVIPAKHILECALRNGEIDRDTLIIESSSGNFALGLAVVCRELGLRLHIVGDPAIDPALRRMLSNLGVEVDIIEKPDALGAYQRLRLERVDELLRTHANAYWIRQYDNAGNPAAYQGLASHLSDTLGDEFDLVASVGSGGSSVGLSRALRRRNPGMRLTGVDTFRSVLFGLPDGKRTLRGLGNSVMPLILDHSQFDRIHWLTSGIANRAALMLHAEHALFCGPTSGAAYWAARHEARLRPDRRVVFLCPDTGYRYLSSVHDEAWLRANGEFAPVMPAEPVHASALGSVEPSAQWATLEWRRCTLEQVRARGAAGVLEAMS